MNQHAKKRASMKARLEELTGRHLDDWIALARQSPEATFMGRVGWLKSEHGLGHFQARLVVEELIASEKARD